MDAIGGYVYFDTDQDPTTGVPAEAFFGQPTQDVGMEYFADLFEREHDGVVFDLDADTFEIVARSSTRPSTDHTIAFDMPLEAIGGDDGFINTAHGRRPPGPSDWAPDDGHGTIEPFSDAPWLSETPDSGESRPAAPRSSRSTWAARRCRPASTTRSSSSSRTPPSRRQLPVDVTLTVTLPPEFGAITGTVTDAHSGEPLAGATVDVHATWKGAPLDLSATTADDGTYSIVGPAGTWPRTTRSTAMSRSASTSRSSRASRPPAPTPRSTTTSPTPPSTRAR